MLRLLSIIGLLTVSHAALAQDAEQITAFNEAWYAYAEARDGGDQERLIATAEAVFEKGKEIFPGDDDRLPLLAVNYGDALLRSGEYRQARDVYKEAVDRSKAIYGEQSPRVLPILLNYADSHAALHNSGRQERVYKEALAIAETNFGKTSAEYAGVAFRAGVRIFEKSGANDGLRYLEDAYAIYSELEGSNSQSAGLAAFYAGKVEFGERRHTAATEWFLAALQGLEGDSQYEGYVRAYLVKAYEYRNMSDEATEHCIAIGAITPNDPDQDYLPLFRMAPKYPADLLGRGREGYVDFEFTVDENGFVRDPVVVDGKGERTFEKEALAAVERFRYAPRFENGEPVAVEGVKTRITFEIAR